MNAYTIKVTTKLGSTYENTIFAEDQEAALKAAKVKYPLHKEIAFESEREADKDEAYHNKQENLSPASTSFNHTRFEKAECEKGKRMMMTGTAFMLIGIVTTIAAWISGWIVYWTLLATGYGLIDFLRGQSLYNANKPQVSEADGFERFRNFDK